MGPGHGVQLVVEPGAARARAGCGAFAFGHAPNGQEGNQFFPPDLPFYFFLCRSRSSGGMAARLASYSATHA